MSSHKQNHNIPEIEHISKCSMRYFCKRSELSFFDVLLFFSSILPDRRIQWCGVSINYWWSVFTDEAQLPLFCYVFWTYMSSEREGKKPSGSRDPVKRSLFFPLPIKGVLWVITFCLSRIIILLFLNHSKVLLLYLFIMLNYYLEPLLIVFKTQ